MKRRFGDRGVTSMEFAFVAPMTMLALAGIVEFTLQGAAAVALDFGAHRASRVGMTGNKLDGTQATTAERTQAVKQAVLQGGGGWLDEAKLTISHASYSTVGDVKTSSKGVAGPGAAGQLVTYKLSYEQPFYLSSVAETFLRTTKLNHTSTVLVKNEPFPSN